MSNDITTYEFSPGNLIKSSEVNTNNDDLATEILQGTRTMNIEQTTLGDTWTAGNQTVTLSNLSNAFIHKIVVTCSVSGVSNYTGTTDAIGSATMTISGTNFGTKTIGFVRTANVYGTDAEWGGMAYDGIIVSGGDGSPTSGQQLTTISITDVILPIQEPIFNDNTITITLTPSYTFTDAPQLKNVDIRVYYSNYEFND